MHLDWNKMCTLYDSLPIPLPKRALFQCMSLKQSIFVFGVVVTLLLGSKAYTVGKPVLTLTCCHICNENAFLWVEQQSWLCGLRPWKTCQIFSFGARQVILLLTCLFFVYWIRWFKSEETRHTGYLTIYSFNKQGLQEQALLSWRSEFGCELC